MAHYRKPEFWARAFVFCVFWRRVGVQLDTILLCEARGECSLWIVASSVLAVTCGALWDGTDGQCPLVPWARRGPRRGYGAFASHVPAHARLQKWRALRPAAVMMVTMMCACAIGALQ